MSANIYGGPSLYVAFTKHVICAMLSPHTILQGRFHRGLHFLKVKTEPQRMKQLSQDHSTNK